ncbi:MAG TPA: MCE family protein [Acidimicrobiales bacterium]|nr:MCE family protein [Acidimicrobiales bacterium]
MKSFTERDPRIIGAVVIVVALVIVGGVLFLNRSVFVPSYTVHARFADAAGIGKGAEVTVAGVKVGTVSTVHVDGDSVVADLSIDHGVVLPGKTAAAIEVQTVLGVLDVALEPRTGWDRPLRNGALLTDTSVPVEFQDLQNTAGNLLQQSDVAAFNDLLSSLEAVTSGKQAEVATIISGLDRFTGVVDQRSSQVSSLIDAANTVAATVAQRDQQLASLVDSLATVVQGLAERSADLSALITNTEAVASQTASLVGQNQPQLQGLISHLTSVLAVVQQHQDDLAEGVSYLASAVTGFQSVGYSGTSDTPNSWANIYTNLVGVSGAYGALGNCAALDQALDLILGPDPTSCDQRSGPPVSSSSTSSPASPAGAGGASAATPAAKSPKGSSSGSPSVNSLEQLLEPLVGGSS